MSKLKYNLAELQNDQEAREKLLETTEQMIQGAQYVADRIAGSDGGVQIRISTYQIPENAAIIQQALRGEVQDEAAFDNAMLGIREALTRSRAENEPLFNHYSNNVADFADFLDGIQMPEPGTAEEFLCVTNVKTGVNWADRSEESLQKSDSGTIGGFLGMYAALEEKTKGVQNWEKVPMSAEKDPLVDKLYNSAYAGLAECFRTSEEKLEGIGLLDKCHKRENCKEASQKMAQLFFERGIPRRADELKAGLHNSQKLRNADYIFKKSEEERQTEIAKDIGEKLTDFLLPEVLKPESLPKDATFPEALELYDKTRDQLEHELLPDFVRAGSERAFVQMLDRKDGTQRLTNAFRKHLAGLDKVPGGLPDALRPSAKERIEALQEKLKAEKDAAKKQNLVAEIIATRELAGAQRGGKGLENHADPAAVEARTAKIAAEMNKVYAGDSKGMDKLVAQATSGHGGKMMESYNKAAEPIREAQKETTYLDYIDGLNLDQPTDLEVAKLVAATMMYIREPNGARASVEAEKIDKTAAAMTKEPMFQDVMKDLSTLQNAKMGLGVPIYEKLAEKRAEMKKQQAEKAAEAKKREAELQEKHDAEQIEKDMDRPDYRREHDQKFFDSLKQYGKAKPFTDLRRERVQGYLDAYPSCRAEAMEIIKENNLQGLTVPKIRDVPDTLLLHPEKNKAALEQQKQQEKQQDAPEAEKPAKLELQQE